MRMQKLKKKVADTGLHDTSRDTNDYDKAYDNIIVGDPHLIIIITIIITVMIEHTINTVNDTIIADNPHIIIIITTTRI